MSVAILRLEVRGPRRVRAIFTNVLGAAFVTGLYTVTSTNSLGPSPSVVAAFAIVGLTQGVELQLGADLISGGEYTLNCAAVPAVDATTYTGSDPFRYGNAAKETVDQDAITFDADRVAFGVDLVWAGDFLETAQGDLATAEGLDCALADLAHSIEDDGLPWDPTWGAKLGSFVDAAGPSRVSARGNITAQLRRDDRVEQATVVAEDDPSTPDAVIFTIDPTFRGGRKAREAISYAFIA